MMVSPAAATGCQGGCGVGQGQWDSCDLSNRKGNTQQLSLPAARPGLQRFGLLIWTVTAHLTPSAQQQRAGSPPADVPVAVVPAEATRAADGPRQGRRPAPHRALVRKALVQQVCLMLGDAPRPGWGSRGAGCIAHSPRGQADRVRSWCACACAGCWQTSTMATCTSGTTMTRWVTGRGAGWHHVNTATDHNLPNVVATPTGHLVA